LYKYHKTGVRFLKNRKIEIGVLRLGFIAEVWGYIAKTLSVPMEVLLRGLGDV
jgi:hypothetical protein